MGYNGFGAFLDALEKPERQRNVNLVCNMAQLKALEATDDLEIFEAIESVRESAGLPVARCDQFQIDHERQLVKSVLGR
jgi:hypothetical protein